MLTRRLLAPQSVLSPWDTGARIAILSRHECPRRGAAKSSRAPQDAPNGPSLYNKLFPDHPAPSTSRRRPAPGRENAPAPKPFRSALIRDIKAWGWGEKAQPRTESLETKSQRWGERYIRQWDGDKSQQSHTPMGDADYSTSTNRDLGKPNVSDWVDGQSYSGPAVLELNSASKSLLESDFYRLGRQGQHLDGWASGIVKVVQSRSPTTQEPLGQYFIHFETRAAAMAYMDEVMRLLALSRRAAGVNWHLSSRDPTGPMPLAPKLGAKPGGEGDSDASLRAFTLVPPSAALNIKLRLPHGVSDVDSGMWTANQGVDEKGEHHKVVVWLDGSQVTTVGLLDAIEDDGRERNLQWRLKDGARSVKPVPVAAPQSDLMETLDSVGDGSRQTRFARFVVSFAEPVEARRFARSWHKRRLNFIDRDREVVVHATTLW